MRRFAALTVLAALLALAIPVLAVEEEEGAGQAPPPVTETTGVESNYQPAVTLVPAEPGEPTQPWTARYLIPTGLVLAAVAIFVSVVQYFVRVVRNRYKVVE